MKLNKAQMHQRPTYETLVKDTILEPKDRIALPDRTATILRRTQQLSRYDDVEFIDLEKDNENIMKEQAQQMNVKAAAGNDEDGSLGETRAMQPGPHEGHNFTAQPPPPPPSGGGPPRQPEHILAITRTVVSTSVIKQRTPTTTIHGS